MCREKYLFKYDETLCIAPAQSSEMLQTNELQSFSLKYSYTSFET